MQPNLNNPEPPRDWRADLTSAIDRSPVGIWYTACVLLVVGLFGVIFFRDHTAPHTVCSVALTSGEILVALLVLYVIVQYVRLRKNEPR